MLLGSSDLRLSARYYSAKVKPLSLSAWSTTGLMPRGHAVSKIHSSRMELARDGDERTYSYSWDADGVGSYTLRAVVTNSVGTPAATLTVGEPPPSTVMGVQSHQHRASHGDGSRVWS